MAYSWVVGAGRYRDDVTGKFVSRSIVLQYLRESRDASSDEVKFLAGKVATGKLSPQDFQRMFRQEIQDEFIRQYIVGRGGVGSMTQSDWGRVGRLLRDQYAYAEGFINDLPNLSEAQILHRATLYSQAAGAAFEFGQRQEMLNSNKKEERWELGDAEHCPDCEELAALGWVPIGTLPTVPRAGVTACLVNCQCGIMYR